MGSGAFWALPWAGLLILMASCPVRSEESSVEKITDTTQCQHCNGTECLDKTDCPYLCTEQCPDDFYYVRLISSDKCSSLVIHMDVAQTMTEEKIINRPTVVAPSTQAPATKDTTTTTTPAPVRLMCQRCSLVGCLRCTDERELPQCEKCTEGFFLSNSSHTCSSPYVEDSLGAGAIVGIVVACLCLVGVAAVGGWFLVRRFHRSRDLSHAVEKVNPEAEERQVWRRSCESAVLAGLDIAPQLPEFDPKDNEDFNKSYDALVKGDQNEQSSYAPLNPSQENLYTNTAQILTDNVYGNIQQMGVAEEQPNSGFSRKNPPLAALSQESGDFYEVVENNVGGYGNDNSHLPIQIVEENSEEFYANFNVDDTNDIYQNT